MQKDLSSFESYEGYLRMETRVPSRTGEVNDKQLASNELMRSAPDRVVWVRVLAGDIVSCSWARDYTNI